MSVTSSQNVIVGGECASCRLSDFHDRQAQDARRHVNPDGPAILSKIFAELVALKLDDKGVAIVGPVSSYSLRKVTVSGQLGIKRVEDNI